MTTATAPDYRTTFQAGSQLPPIHPVLASVHRLFFKESGHILISSRMGINEQLQTIEMACDASVAFQSGLNKCLESLVVVVRDYFTKLVGVANGHPEWNISDPLAWAHLRMRELIAELLCPVGSPFAVDRLIRHACDGQAGFIEPWRAPIWILPNFSSFDGFADERSESERMTAEVTQKLLDHKRDAFNERLET